MYRRYTIKLWLFLFIPVGLFVLSFILPKFGVPLNVVDNVQMGLIGVVMPVSLLIGAVLGHPNRVFARMKELERIEKESEERK